MVLSLARFVAMAAGRDPEGWPGRLRRLGLSAFLGIMLSTMGDSLADRVDGSETDVVVATGVDLDAPDRSSIVTAPDPQVAVASGEADVGVALDGSGGYEVLVASGEASSDSAFVVLEALAQARSPRAGAIEDVAIEPSPERRNEGAARSAIYVYAFMAQSVLLVTTGALAGKASPGALEALLVHPVRRWAIAVGLTVGLLPVTAVAVAISAAIASAVSLAPVEGFGAQDVGVIGAAVGIAASAATVVPLLAATGAVMVLGETRRESSPVVGVVVLTAVVGGLVAAQRVLDPPSLFATLPFLSQATAVGRAVSGTLAATDLLWCLGTALAGTGVLLLLCRRLVRSGT